MLNKYYLRFSAYDILYYMGVVFKMLNVLLFVFSEGCSNPIDMFSTLWLVVNFSWWATVKKNNRFVRPNPWNNISKTDVFRGKNHPVLQ